jgi:hypothetical protein
MKHFLAISAGVASSIWVGPQVLQALGLQATGGFDMGDAVQVLITVLCIYASLYFASMV